MGRQKGRPVDGSQSPTIPLLRAQLDTLYRSRVHQGRHMFWDPVRLRNDRSFRTHLSGWPCNLCVYFPSHSNIVPYIKKHGKNPVTGASMSTKELIKLNFHKSPQGDYHCPLTYKVFNENSYIVAIKTSGNVFSYEALNELNFKPKKWTDLVSGELFERSDVITLQNPNDWSKRQVEHCTIIN